MYALLERSIIYLDNSIMPWFNNITNDYLSWFGITEGQNPLMSSISITGTNAVIITGDTKYISFRYYIKLD